MYPSKISNQFSNNFNMKDSESQVLKIHLALPEKSCTYELHYLQKMVRKEFDMISLILKQFE